jgi:protein tyrosine phosphatase
LPAGTVIDRVSIYVDPELSLSSVYKQSIDGLSKVQYINCSIIPEKKQLATQAFIPETWLKYLKYVFYK